MASGRLTVDDAVAERFDDYAAVVLYAEGLTNGPSNADSVEALARGADAARRSLAGRPASEHPHMAAWRSAFRAFGAKPSRYPSSAEALLKRVLRGENPPPINRLVDAYNAISLQYLLPVGGEDLHELAGQGRLKLADGSERFVAFGAGRETIEHPEPGEVIWADDEGVTCRRWSWRQCRRTQLTETSTSAYFLLERLAPLPLEELRTAADHLHGRLKTSWPSASVVPARLGPGWSRGR